VPVPLAANTLVATPAQRPCPTVTGIGVQYFGGYNSTFWIVAALSIAAILAVWVFVRWPTQAATAVAAG